MDTKLSSTPKAIAFASSTTSMVDEDGAFSAPKTNFAPWIVSGMPLPSASSNPIACASRVPPAVAKSYEPMWSKGPAGVLLPGATSPSV